MNTKQKTKGFTIIEVVLVLAIAGLIFLMVFIALLSLQRNQRDTQRKNDLGRVITSVTSYASSNRGSLPTFDQTFIDNYLTVGGDTFFDPSGANTTQATSTANYLFNTTTATALSGGFDSSSNQNLIYVNVNAVCDDVAGTITSDNAGSRKLALRIVLESGGYYCVNN